MQAYLNLEEIEGVWVERRDRFWNAAIAKVIGEEVGSDTLHDRIVEIAKKHVEDRKNSSFLTIGIFR